MQKAILFDMDGTLVDTEIVDNDVALKVCKKLGFELTREEQEERHGRTTKSFYEYLFEKRGGGFDLQAAIKDQLDGFEAELRRGVDGFPGAKEIPGMLKAGGYKLAVVSGSTRSQIEIVIKALEADQYFEVIISADDAAKSKPSPEGYLLAAKKLKVLPGECVVIEDGVKGIKAGKEAGMKVIGVVNNGGQDLSLADLIVKNLAEIDAEMLRRL